MAYHGGVRPFFSVERVSYGGVSRFFVVGDVSTPVGGRFFVVSIVSTPVVCRFLTVGNISHGVVGLPDADDRGQTGYVGPPHGAEKLTAVKAVPRAITGSAPPIIQFHLRRNGRNESAEHIFNRCLGG